ncbi:MAG: M23 family metallopeptidase [Deltaproteobacteria bacterium]|nr:M23 family metallopeptidase [Deltaproteobacteria bacterium]
MTNDTMLFVLGGGIGAASALALHARRSSPRPLTPIATLATNSGTDNWIYPVPSLGDRYAETSNEFNPGTTNQHLGVDIMFRRRDRRDLIAAYPAGTPNGTAWYFMPERIPVLAASSGIVTFAAPTPVGHSVIVRHANGWATYYTHLATLEVQKGQSVVAGQSLGTIGASPLDGERLMHLHFEIWLGGVRAGAIDPDPHLATWPRVTIGWSPPTPTLVPSSLRNGALSSYRPIGETGEPYPTWIRSLRGQSGVYVIREIGGPIVYVGSSVARLYDTLTRHFQTWRRYKGFWRGQFAEGADPGLTYDRGAVEVAVKTTTPDEAHDEERRMIRRLKPRDNQLGQSELEDAPF